MKVVIDTNIFLVSISRRSPFHWIFQRLVEGDFILSITNEILMEYAEKIGEHMGTRVSDSTMKALTELPNMERVDIYFKWNLIKDQDDNKFTDCAIASGADWLVTHDRDFQILKDIPFPKVNVLSAKEFKTLLEMKTDSQET
jgi:putative PIN family toxin of toxin-antitoxin system